MALVSEVSREEQGVRTCNPPGRGECLGALRAVVTWSVGRQVVRGLEGQRDIPGLWFSGGRALQLLLDLQRRTGLL